MMETEIIKWAIMTALGGVVYFMKRTLDQQDTHIAELQKTVQDIKEKYLHKDDFKEFKTELRGWFEEIKTDIRNLQK